MNAGGLGFPPERPSNDGSHCLPEPQRKRVDGGRMPPCKRSGELFCRLPVDGTDIGTELGRA
jgi:hypothetical protein